MRKTTFSEILEKMSASKEYLIFSIGDSITEGAHATTDDTTYTAVLAREIAAHFPTRTVLRYDGRSFETPDSEILPLETHGTPITVQAGENGKITVSRCGIGGNSTRRLLRRRADFIGKKLEGRTGDLFLIVVGINDSIEKNPDKFATPSLYAEHLHTLIDDIERTHLDADIVLMTPTYYDYGTERASRLDPYVAEMKAIATTRKIPLVDLHALWMDHLVIGADHYGQGDWLDTDRCHPTDIGHTAIGLEIARHLLCK